MSYSIRVVVKDGKAEVDLTGTSVPPDGIFNINGHVPLEGTWQAESINIMRSTDESHQVIQASATCHTVPAIPAAQPVQEGASA